MDATEELRMVRGELAALRDQVARMTQPTEYLTTKQTADLLGVSLDALLMWRQTRSGPPFVQTTSKFVRYRRADVERWMEENLVK